MTNRSTKGSRSPGSPYVLRRGGERTESLQRLGDQGDLFFGRRSASVRVAHIGRPLGRPEPVFEPEEPAGGVTPASDAHHDLGLRPLALGPPEDGPRWAGDLQFYPASADLNRNDTAPSVEPGARGRRSTHRRYSAVRLTSTEHEYVTPVNVPVVVDTVIVVPPLTRMCMTGVE
jgi:hypothetical protein